MPSDPAPAPSSPNPYRQAAQPYAQFMVDYITDVCDRIGPRMSTSDEEARAAEDLEQRLDEYCDNTTIEPFCCHPGALLGHIKIVILIYAIGVALCFARVWYLPIIGGALAISGLVIFILELFHLKEVIDGLFPERQSHTTIGVHRPAGASDPKTLLIVSGHLDSAWEFPLVHDHKTALMVMIVNTVASIILTTAVGIVKGVALALGLAVAHPILFGALSILDLVFFYSLVGVVTGAFLAFRITSNRQSPGASDNLSGCAVALALAKYYHEHPDRRPERTELRFIGFGCEECMRGSKRYVAAHRDEFDAYERTILINIDGVGAGAFYIVEEEKMYTSKHSPAVIDILARAAAASAVEAPAKTLPLGGTDAAFFSKSAVPASSIVCIGPDGLPLYWHTLDDLPKYIERANMEAAMAICLAAVDIVDRRE